MGRITRYMPPDAWRLLRSIAHVRPDRTFTLIPAKARAYCARDWRSREEAEAWGIPVGSGEYYDWCASRILRLLEPYIELDPLEEGRFLQGVREMQALKARPVELRVRIRDKKGERAEPLTYLALPPAPAVDIGEEEVEYYTQGPGGRRLRNIIPLTAKTRLGKRLYPVFVPALFWDVKRRLEAQGYKVEPEGFRLPPLVKSVPVTRAPRLREYQERALRRWLERGGRGSVRLPTGAGKTFVALGAIAALRVPTLILVPTTILAKQWVDRLVEHLGLPREAIGRLDAGHREIGKPVLVATYHSAAKNAWLLSQLYPLVVYDEAHRAAANFFKRVALESLAPYRLALSATLEREDGNERLIYRLVGPVVYSRRYWQLVREGYLAPVKIYFAPVELGEEEKRKYMELHERREELLELLDMIRSGLKIEERPGEIGGELKRIEQRLVSIEADNREKNRAAVELVTGAVARGRSVIVFTRYARQARKLYNELAGRLGEDRVGLILSETPAREREELFDRFRRGEMRVLVTAKVLDEGVDAPRADTAVIVSSQSLHDPRQFIQRIGRVVRYMKDKQAEAYILVSRIGEVRGKEESAMPELMEKLAEEYGRENVTVLRRLQPA